MTRIIGIAGADKAGKSTFAKKLKDYYSNFESGISQDISIFNFARGVYEEVAALNNVDTAEVFINKDFYRQQLREVGEGYKRINKNYWINSTFFLIDNLLPDVAIIDDVRFLREAIEIKRREGWIIFLDRECSQEEMKDSTFRQLPYVAKISDYIIPAKSGSSEKIIEKLTREKFIRMNLSVETKKSYNEMCKNKIKFQPCIKTQSLSDIYDNLPRYDETLLKNVISAINHSAKLKL